MRALMQPLRMRAMNKMHGARMDETEFRWKLNRYGLTITEACSAVYFETDGAVIRPKTITKAFSRGECLSAAMTAAFRLLFNRYEKRRKKHGQAA